MIDKTLLVVEDEDDIQELIAYNLKKEGFKILKAESAEKAYGTVLSEKIDLIILDIMLEGMNGIEFCKKIKNDEDLKKIPVIMLTAKGEEEDIIKGLEAGADDYITKPFSPKILSARVKTVLRRNQKGYDTFATILTHDLVIKPEKREVLLNETNIELTNTEFNILHFLSANLGRVYTRYQIIDEIKGNDYAVADRSIDFLIAGLRKKLGNAGNYIETVRGVGYRFKE
jgi:two-component system, OmpR family, alkaline phosphatase synthesis response regulator PhoP